MLADHLDNPIALVDERPSAVEIRDVPRFWHVERGADSRHAIFVLVYGHFPTTPEESCGSVGAKRMVTVTLTPAGNRPTSRSGSKARSPSAARHRQ